MLYYVYVIASLKKKYIYVGLTKDINSRIFQHNKGYNKTTAPYRPFKNIRLEQYQTRTKARAREKYLKSGIGKELIKSSMPRWWNW